ncbi:MAG TPA: hypothetical protein VNA20_10575 [Frankiaceae bacterium]|nr:hypothetical protein [Frankiaceae bacterium]
MSRDPVVVVPGDLDVEDRIAGPVTFRMAAWLAAAVAGAALIAAGRGAIAPTVLGLVLLVVGVAGAWWRPGGRPVVAWVAPLLAFRKRRRSYLAATAAEEDAPEPAVVEPEPEPTEPPPPDTEPMSEPTQSGPPSKQRRSGRVVAAAVTSAAVVTVAAVVFTTSRGGESAPAPHIVEVVAPEPTANPPVVVVVPVDPFTGWEVGDGVDPFCGC